MRILVTGGTGFIGSHTCVALLDAGYDVTALDNLFNSDASVIGRVGQICGREPAFVEGDIRDALLLKTLFAEQPISAVLHFAGLKAVGESVKKPQAYFENNVGGTAVLLSAMQQADVKTIVFSSSATVYGDPASVPITEDFPLSATNPYGDTKLKIENMLAEIFQSKPGWRIARLRYFNPVGAHPSGTMGEDPEGIPNNLVPYVMQVAVGRHEKVRVFGDDYDTPDGTPIRDYVHVMDVAEAHVAALDALVGGLCGATAVNLGTGVGSSVLDVIRAASAAVGAPIRHEVVERRPGDIAQTWAATGHAAEVLGWRATRDLDEMLRDHWRWQSSHPDGFT